ncbi:hypothetical protein ACS5NO_09505 [Larkinella sp. GY13]|uniref:hypothetical protein n=1 Tax=Larkinella sp. GY13 TaxID=3453720 RepID=UPI003EE9BEDB
MKTKYVMLIRALSGLCASGLLLLFLFKSEAALFTDDIAGTIAGLITVIAFLVFFMKFTKRPRK